MALDIDREDGPRLVVRRAHGAEESVFHGARDSDSGARDRRQYGHLQRREHGAVEAAALSRRVAPGAHLDAQRSTSRAFWSGVVSRFHGLESFRHVCRHGDLFYRRFHRADWKRLRARALGRSNGVAVFHTRSQTSAGALAPAGRGQSGRESRHVADGRFVAQTIRSRSRSDRTQPGDRRQAQRRGGHPAGQFCLRASAGDVDYVRERWRFDGARKPVPGGPGPPSPGRIARAGG